MRRIWHKSKRSNQWLKSLSLGILFSLVTLLATSVFAQPLVRLHSTNKAQLRQAFISELKHQGVQVITLGETVTVIFPSDQVFKYDSANLARSFKPILNLTALLLQTYTTESVSVGAYSDNLRAGPRKDALSTRQAQVVSDYLWSVGVDTRLMVAKGHGDQSPIAWNGRAEGRSLNRRIVIRFRFYPPYRSYD